MKKISNKKYTNILKNIIVAVLLVCLFLFQKEYAGMEKIEQLVSKVGHIGIFLAAAVSGFNIFVPIPLAAFFPTFLSAGFSFISIIILLSAGMVVGDAFGYIIGYLGRKTLDQKQMSIMNKIKKLEEKNKFLPAIGMFFYAAFVPLPNELIIIPLGFLRSPFWSVMLAVFLGNIIFNTLFGLGFSYGPNVLS